MMEDLLSLISVLQQQIRYRPAPLLPLCAISFAAVHLTAAPMRTLTNRNRRVTDPPQ
jgi:hypothetical protein